MNEVVSAAYGERVYDLAVGFEPLDALRGGRVATPLRFEVEGFLPRQPADEKAPTARPSGPGSYGRWSTATIPASSPCSTSRGWCPATCFCGSTSTAGALRRRFSLPILSLEMAQAMPGANRVRRPVFSRAPPAAFSARSTGIRARVLRDGAPLRWTRVEARLESGGFLVGRAHGDDRGEFLLVLDPRAAPAAELVDPLEVRVTVFAPAMAPAPMPATLPAEDFLWDLPLEILPAAGGRIRFPPAKPCRTAMCPGRAGWFPSGSAG